MLKLLLIFSLFSYDANVLSPFYVVSGQTVITQIDPATLEQVKIFEAQTALEKIVPLDANRFIALSSDHELILINATLNETTPLLLPDHGCNGVEKIVPNPVEDKVAVELEGCITVIDNGLSSAILYQADQPVWSPDGRYLAYLSPCADQFCIYTDTAFIAETNTPFGINWLDKTNLVYQTDSALIIHNIETGAETPFFSHRPFDALYRLQGQHKPVLYGLRDSHLSELVLHNNEVQSGKTIAPVYEVVHHPRSPNYLLLKSDSTILLTADAGHLRFDLSFEVMTPGISSPVETIVEPLWSSHSQYMLLEDLATNLYQNGENRQHYIDFAVLHPDYDNNACGQITLAKILNLPAGYFVVDMAAHLADPTRVTTARELEKLLRASGIEAESRIQSTSGYDPIQVLENELMTGYQPMVLIPVTAAGGNALYSQKAHWVLVESITPQVVTVYNSIHNRILIFSTAEFKQLVLDGSDGQQNVFAIRYGQTGFP